MTGITAYGMYVPFNRLERRLLASIYNKKVIPGEKAVANYDEDSLTMAVSAASNCTDSKNMKYNALFFASTTSPYKEKQIASNIAAALDLDGAIRTSDFTGTLKAGANAILSALDIAEKGECALVAVADCRLGSADSSYETSFGDGAAAIAFGNTDVIAEYMSSYSVSYDFYDVWRADSEKYPHYFDEKFGMTIGYEEFVLESIRGLLKKVDMNPEHISKVVLDGATDRHSKSVLKKAGFSTNQLQESLIGHFGYTGAAYTPMQLCCALEQSVPGDTILYVSYGEGSDAILFKACKGSNEPGAGRGLSYYINNKKTDISYEQYLKWKEMLDFEKPRRPDFQRSNLPDFYRKRKKNLACYGSCCTVCGTPHFPPSRICVQCKSIDKMEPYPFKGKAAKLATYTLDNVGISKDSPNVCAVIDFEGGGRMFTYMMDCYIDKLEIGMPVELTYRKMFSADGINTYFWKCVPVNSTDKEAQT